MDASSTILYPHFKTISGSSKSHIKCCWWSLKRGKAAGRCSCHSLPCSGMVENSNIFILYVTSVFRHRGKDTVAYFLKARTVEPEKQPLLANDCETEDEMTSVTRQQILNKNRRPLQGNGSVNTLPRQRIRYTWMKSVVCTDRAEE
jgi:hypothetical protein